MTNRRNWENMRRDFCEGVSDDDGNKRFPSLSEIGEIYNCSYSALSKKSSAEKWKERRKNYIEKLEEKRQEVQINESAQFHAKVLDISKALLSYCAKYIIEHQEFGKTVPPIELNRLSQVVARMTTVGLQALGETSVPQSTPLIDFANELIAKMSK